MLIFLVYHKPKTEAQSLDVIKKDLAFLNHGYNFKN